MSQSLPHAHSEPRSSHRHHRHEDDDGEPNSFVCNMPLLMDQQKSSNQNHRRPKGALAFLPDRVDYYPIDDNDPRTARQQQQVDAVEEPRRQIDLTDWLQDVVVVVIVLLNPGQPYSTRVRQNLEKLLQAHQSSDDKPRIRCLALVAGVSTSSQSRDRSSEDSMTAVDHFFRGTGFAVAPLTATLSTVLQLTQVPTLATVDMTGRKISVSHEELALEWNDLEYVAEKWCQGESALSVQQQVLATAIFPTCTLL